MLYFCTIRIGQGRIFIQVIICRNSPVEKKLNTVYALLKGNVNIRIDLQLACKCNSVVITSSSSSFPVIL